MRAEHAHRIQKLIDIQHREHVRHNDQIAVTHSTFGPLADGGYDQYASASLGYTSAILDTFGWTARCCCTEIPTVMLSYEGS